MESPSEINPVSSEEDNLKGLVPIIIIPTDQAWVVVLVSLCQNFFLESIPLTMLLFIPATPSGSSNIVEDKYYIGGVFFGLGSLLTPISCALVNWYSFKAISIIGPTVIFVSMVVTYFTQEQFGLSLFFLSMVGGFGCSMINATSKCLPTIWFCNRRGMACQISALGQTLGILFIPWFTKHFLESFHYSISDFYLLCAGMYIPLIAIGFALPKLYGITLEVQDTKTAVSKVKFMDQETAVDLARSMSILENTISNLIFKTFHNLMFPRVKDIIKDRSLFILIPDEVMARTADPPWRPNRPNRERRSTDTDMSRVSISVLGVQEIQMLLSRNIPGYGCRPFYRVDIFYSASVTGLNIYYRQINQLDYHMAVSRAVSRKDFQQEVGRHCLVFPEAMTRTILSMLHITICKQLYFIVLQVAIAICYASHFVPFIFINDRGLEFGLGKEMSFSLVYFIGCGSLIGRIITCAFFTLSPCSVEKDFNFMFEMLLISQGILSLASNHFEYIEFQMAYSLVTGVYMSLSSLGMVGYICRITGIFNLTNAIGYQLIFQGGGIMLGVIICANVNRIWGTVKCAYYIAGLCMLVSAVLFMPLKKLKKISRESATDLV